WIYPNNMTYSRAWIYYCKAGGLAFGFISGGVMSDNFGRRRTTYASFILLCAAQCMTGLFQSLVAFIVCQFCVGTGAGCFILSSLVLVIECLGHDWRDICLCLLPWWTGPSLLSLGAWFLRHWRHLAVISGLAGAPLIGTYFLVLESSRWLICKNRFAEAESVTKEMIACNCKPVPDMTSLFDISRACVLTTMHTKKYCYSDFMSTRRLRKATVALVFTWLPGCMVYCSLLRRLARLTSSVYLGHVLVFNSASVVIGSAVLINKCIGRRWCMFLYAMSTGLVSACVLVLHVTNDVIDQQMVTWLAFFANLGVTATMTLLAVVTLETFPTVIRSMACSVGLLLGLVGYIITDLLHVYLDPFHYTVPFLVYGALMTLVALGMLGFPETGRTPLPDILRCRHRKLCAHDVRKMKMPERDQLIRMTWNPLCLSA
ncbi:hypothetical protein DPMN_026641, partial [Dreissena polymorpha]